MRTKRVTILLIILALPLASASYLSEDDVLYGPDSPTSHYRNLATGAMARYDATLRVLTPAPAFTSSDNLFLTGFDVSLLDNAETFVDEDEIPPVVVACGEGAPAIDFCLVFRVRVQGSYSLSYRYNFTGRWPDGSWAEWSPMGVWTPLNHTSLGQPLVTGGTMMKPQATVLSNCQVFAQIKAIRTDGTSSTVYEEGPQDGLYCGSTY